MKKVTIFLIAMCATISAFAQFEQGRKLVGGSLSFTTTTNMNKLRGGPVKNYKQTEFSFAPNFAIFVVNNLAVGTALEFNTGIFKPEDGSPKTNYSSVQLTPMVRYYLPQRFFFQGQVGLGLAKSKTIGTLFTDEDKSNLTSWSLGAGYSISLNDFLAIEPIMGWGVTSVKNKETDVKEIDKGFFVRVGFQIYLN
jgi:hypothetical protein